jgi:hypothetical protein
VSLKIAVPDQIMVDGRPIHPAMRTWMELITRAVLAGGGGGGPVDAEYVVMALNGTLTNERRLVAGQGITITDGGANGDVTIALEEMATYKNLFSVLLTGSNATLYTSPALTTTVVKSIWIANTDSAAVTVTLYRVESGGSAADNRALMKTVSVEANSSYQVTDEMVLEAGQTLEGFAGTANKVTVSGSGVQIA